MTVDVPRDSRLPNPESGAYRWVPHWIALAAAAFTLPLLYVGGSVTTYRVGLAVPDWPTTFGINMFLYDFWNAPFGVRVEHTHRLYGAAVGLFTILLAGWLLVHDRRRWMKAMGVLALVSVIVQGVLGGTRVTQLSTTLAAIHGVTGQLFFGLMVALCVWTGRDWTSSLEARPDTDRMRPLAVALLLIVCAQIAFGSWVRHFGTWPALIAHAGLAAAVWLAVIILAVRVGRARATLPFLVPPALALTVLAGLQIALGIAAFFFLLPFDGDPKPVSFYQAVVRTAHQTQGALLLAASIVVALRTFRHLVGVADDAGWDRAGDLIPTATPAALSREALA
jgi:cytochrome c oxidase assembly protein subunit 15